MANIYEINDRFIGFQRMIEEAGDELDEQTIADTLESLEGEVTDKLKGYAAVLKNIEGDIEGMKAAEKAIANRRKFAENKVAKLQSVIDQTMVLHRKNPDAGVCDRLSEVPAEPADRRRGRNPGRVLDPPGSEARQGRGAVAAKRGRRDPGLATGDRQEKLFHQVNPRGPA